MLKAAFLLCGLVLVEALKDHSGFNQGYFAAYPQSPGDCKITCEKIARSISSASQVFYPGSKEFDLDITHWVNSSSQAPVCTVEPGTPNDVSLIVNSLQQIARARVPFAVKGGGHTSNLGFSSTLGVHVSMTRFNDIVIRNDSRAVEIGAGLTWADVYAYLIPKGLNVVGARMNGVGVAGFTLGGGYSWKSSQYGLAVDSVTEFHLVLPNGTEVVVTEAEKDLWFSLKGGFNNYGIVTKFTLKLYPQTDIWGALLNFEGDLAEPAEKVFLKFLSRPHDRKAAQTGKFLYSHGSVLFGLLLFYDGPKPPPGLYDELLNLSSTTTTIVRGTYTDLLKTQDISPISRVSVDAIPMLRYTEPIMKAFKNETTFWGDRLRQYDDSVLLFYVIEPFEADFLTHGEPSAYPPDRSLAVLPSIVFAGWANASADEFMIDTIRLSAASLVEAGIRDGQDLKNAAPYVNYALFGTPLERMYGGHLDRLREIRKKYDPDDIMRLAGGWKL